LRPLKLVVFGESGVGKSYLCDTAPGPRLILDAEGGTLFTPSSKIPWDPRGPIPALGPDDSAVVYITKYDDLERAFQWLPTGQHPFRSVIIDSLSELQKRCVDVIAGTAAMQQSDYGTLLRKIEAHVRSFRDLTMNPVRMIEVIALTAGSREKGLKDPVIRPLLLGQMAEQLAYFVDVQGYLTNIVGPDGGIERKLQVVPINNVAAKDRTGRLGISVTNPTIPGMQTMIWGPERQE
jgi:AAA domain